MRRFFVDAQKKLFLKWLVVNSSVALLLGSAIFAYWSKLGAIGPAAKIVSIIILLLFTGVTLYSGSRMWLADLILEDEYTKVKTSEQAGVHQYRIRSLLYDAEHLGFFAWLLQNLGLLGTAIGFLILFSALPGFNLQDPNGIHNLFAHLAKGGSTALVSTIVGVFCAKILVLMQHYLTNALERIL